MIPHAALRQRITVEPFLGTSAYGPRWGDPVTVRARVVGKRRSVRQADGTDIISSASAIIRPDLRFDQVVDEMSDGFDQQIPLESRVTWDDRLFEVIDVLVGQGLTRPEHLELVLS